MRFFALTFCVLCNFLRFCFKVNALATYLTKKIDFVELSYFLNKFSFQDVLDILLTNSAFSLFLMTSQSPVKCDVTMQNMENLQKIAIKT